MNTDLGLNRYVSDLLWEMGRRLAARGADRFRVDAFRKASHTIARLNEDVAALRTRGGRGALVALPGVGVSIAEAIEEMIATGHWERLDGLGAAAREAPPEPPVAQLLGLDVAYRRRARDGSLPLTAPTEHNPSRAEWLPVMRARRGPWCFTVSFSNSERAHQLARTSDWVVLHFRYKGRPSLSRTVVTETKGPLRRKRVVRGRETECRDHYTAGTGSSSSSSSSSKPSGSKTNAA